MEDVLYTVKEAAIMLKCNQDRVHALRKAGLLPFLKLGQWKVRRVTIEEFLAKYEGYDLTDPNDIKRIE